MPNDARCNKSLRSVENVFKPDKVLVLQQVPDGFKISN
jgi:hypothetical protein